MMKARIKELEQEIEKKDKFIKRNPKSDNSYHLKAEYLVELGKLKNNDLKCYIDGLECYNKAIDLAPENALYVADRMKLHVTMGHPELAVEDIKKIKDLPQEEDGVLGLYMENTMQDIASLDEIQNTIKELQSSGQIDTKLAAILDKHARVTANLVVQVGAHGKTLNIHDQDIAYLKAVIADLVKGKELTKAQIAGLELKASGLESKVEQNTAKLQGLEEKTIKTEKEVDQLKEDSSLHEEMIIGMKDDLDMLKPLTTALHKKVESSSSLNNEAKQEMQKMVSHLEASMSSLKVQTKDQEGIMNKVIARVQNLSEQQDFTQSMLTDLCTDVDQIKDGLLAHNHTESESFVLMGDTDHTGNIA